MSRDYAENRIRESLKMHGGNLLLARQQVSSWASSDPDLLFALVRPHLNGIVAYQVERVASGRAEKERREEPAARKQSPEPQSYSGDNFGMDLLRAVASSSAEIFGRENIGVPLRKGKASQNHIDAIRQISSKSISRKDKK